MVWNPSRQRNTSYRSFRRRSGAAPTGHRVRSNNAGIRSFPHSRLDKSRDVPARLAPHLARFPYLLTLAVVPGLLGRVAPRAAGRTQPLRGQCARMSITHGDKGKVVAVALRAYRFSPSTLSSRSVRSATMASETGQNGQPNCGHTLSPL
jgi:hypothetical protein